MNRPDGHWGAGEVISSAAELPAAARDLVIFATAVHSFTLSATMALLYFAHLGRSQIHEEAAARLAKERADAEARA
mgnify:CR=1 FL=1